MEQPPPDLIITFILGDAGQAAPGELGRSEEPIAVYDKVVRRFGACAPGAGRHGSAQQGLHALRVGQVGPLTGPAGSIGTLLRLRRASSACPARGTRRTCSSAA
jgi:hypothetical protein